MTLTDAARLELAQPTLRELRSSGRWIDVDDGMVMLEGWFTSEELSALIQAMSFGLTPEETK